MGSLSYVSIKKVAETSGEVEFIPTYNTPDTIYYQCGIHKNMGGEINVINSAGAVENQQEFYLLYLHPLLKPYALSQVIFLL